MSKMEHPALNETETETETTTLMCAAVTDNHDTTSVSPESSYGSFINEKIIASVDELMLAEEGHSTCEGVQINNGGPSVLSRLLVCIIIGLMMFLGYWMISEITYILAYGRLWTLCWP
ncbi:Protein of unknown function [Pyronema omphalodes CBS 100304]|uniref:Uncharacterized protein n=1 Tax=Pyronema omphalodes (strain CBS 100304) TaxID=1076935 RepID=U4LSS2_PYROM|nr:Protein of unknown function [Pyronema omphalodes CBS 100304]